MSAAGRKRAGAAAGAKGGKRAAAGAKSGERAAAGAKSTAVTKRSPGRPRRVRRVRRVRRATLIAAVLAVVLLLGVAYTLVQRHGGRGRRLASRQPALAYEQSPGGARTALIDVEALGVWCARQRLPAPPALERAEAQVAETLMRALAAAAARRDAASLGEAGCIYESLEAHATAAAYFRLAAAADPSDHRWPYYLGCIQQENGDSDAALAAFADVLRLAPDYPVTYARLAQLELEAGQLDAAERHLERYRALRPRDWLGDVGLGRVALARHEPERALVCLERAAARQPDDFQVQVTLGRAHAALGHREQAERHLARAAELPQGGWFRMRDPLIEDLHRAARSAAALAAELERLQGSGDLPRLAELAAAIIERRPDDVVMMGNLAAIDRKLGRYSQAHATLARALALQPSAPRLHNLEAEVLLAEGRFAAAVACADSVLRLEPDDARALATRGRALVMLERYEEAEAALGRSLELAPRDAANLYVLAETYRLEGKLDAAIAALERVLALAPGHPQAAERLQLLRRHRQARLDPAASPH